MNEHDLSLRLTRKRTVADGVVALDLTSRAGDPLPAWEPGAHIDLQCGDVVRQYSLCGDPADTTTYTVAVRREALGRGGSRHVHDVLAEGDLVTVRGPRNNFPLVDAKRYLFIAGGIGLTPLLPMIAAAHRAEIGFTLVYGGRTLASMPYAQVLRDRHPEHVTLHPQDEVGLLDLESLLAAPESGTAVYCCGPEPLLQAVERHAPEWHDVSLHVERFSPKDIVAGADTDFEVEIASTGRTLRVPAGQSALSVLESAGVPVLSSCTEGTCGTCETGVLSGEVDHRDSLLTAEEQSAHDVMFVCVSRARSTRLVLDL